MKEEIDIGVRKPVENTKNSQNTKKENTTTQNNGDIDLDFIKKTLSTIVTTIRDMRNQHYKISIEKNDIEKRMKVLETDAMRVATEAVDESGKKINTNAESRKVYAENYLSKHDEYNKLSERVTFIENEIKRLNNELEYNSYLFRSIEIISRYRG